MNLIYPACVYNKKDDGFTVNVPDLPGCGAEGDTLADALIRATDAASGFVLNELESGNTPPVASKPTDITPDDGGFTTLLILDMDAYAEKYSVKVVRKNLTIPAWLNTFAEKKHINFSKVLHESLVKMYQQSEEAAK